MEYTATYSPEDNKLRLYASSRLDAETYAKVKAAGFIWAPKQGVFVAPMWTPSREDLLIELAGEIGDEDTSLMDRAEQRSERFEEYSDKRESDAMRARESVSAIADGIPLGQPILVGHHSEKHARRDAEKIENGMRRAVKMWETSKYWAYRAKAAVQHAEYKAEPGVRARRIKGLEADARKQEKYIKDAEASLKAWETIAALPEEKQEEIAIRYAGSSPCRLTLAPKEGDRPDWNYQPTAYDALTTDGTYYAKRTVAEIVEAARRVFPRSIAHHTRWLEHYRNRLVYEKAMLEEDGASDLLKPKERPKQLPLCNYRAPEGISIPNVYNRGEMIHYPQIEMTQAEYSGINIDYKGTRVVGNSHRVRTCVRKHSLYCVFLTDSKVHEVPASIEPKPREPKPQPEYKPKPVDPVDEEFKAMESSLKAGVKVVSANQLFPTPPELAARMVEMANIQPGECVLEPSVGTGNLVKAVLDRVDTEVLGYEISQSLCHELARKFPSYKLQVRCADFLEVSDFMGQYPVVLMNPPFENGSDIKHILHARKFLKPSGRLVAICANGSRQARELEPIADYWEPLPDGTFASSGTGVRTVLLVIMG